jgi:4,5-dihydroxyphthalate decarboxylase
MPITWTAALGRYPHTAALREGRVASDILRLDCADIPNITRAFAPMVRELRFDVSEMAIATFLQAEKHGKPLDLLPVVLSSRLQEGSLLCRTDSPIRGPADLAGKRVGVRAYSQTTGLWLRGILQDSHGVKPESIRWTTFEDPHVAEAGDPPWAERAPDGSEIGAMLRDGALDAAIFGSDAPPMEWARPVFPDVAAAGRDFVARHGFVPVNHLVVVRRDRADPALVAELLRMVEASDAEAPSGLPRGWDALAAPLALARWYATEQGLI